MHGAVDLLFQESHLELVGEQPFGADLGERLVELLVAGRFESDEL